MFDDLHDPAPPTVGTDTLAAVAVRARRMRRRRTALTGAGVLGASLLAVAAVAVVSRGEPTIVPASPDRLWFDDPAQLYLDLDESARLPRCAGAPLPPPWLEDGSLPGEAVDEQLTVVGQTYRTVRWGSDDVAVRQFVDPDAVLWPERAMPSSAETSSGPVPFVAVPGGVEGTRHVRMIDEPDACRRDYLVGDMRLGVGLDLGVWALQWALARAGLDAIDRGESGICATIAGVDASCILDSMIDRELETGAAAMAYQVLSDAQFGPVTLAEYQEVGIAQVVVGADDLVAPLSRLAIEVPIAGTRLKTVVDLTPPADEHCVTVTSPSGERRSVAAAAPVIAEGTVESPEIDCSALVDDPATPPTTTPPTTVEQTSATPVARVDVDAECLASLAPVWMPDGSANDGAVEEAVVNLPDGSEVGALSWSSRRTGAVLLQLDTLDISYSFDASPPQFAYDVRADALSAELSLITIGRRDDGCTAQFLFDGTADQALVFAHAWTDQMTLAESGIGVSAAGGNLHCVELDGITRDTDCLGVDPARAAVGAVAEGFVVPADGFGSPVRGPVGVVFVLIPADADISPRSRLAQDQLLDGTDWKAVLDVVPADTFRCLDVSDGSSTFTIGTSIAGSTSSCPPGP